MDLFVRVSNDVAIDMYKKFGYVVYRRVIGYYSGLDEEDAFGMFPQYSARVLVWLFSLLHAFDVVPF